MTRLLWNFIGIAIVALLTLGIGALRWWRFPTPRERKSTLLFVAVGMLVCAFALLQMIHAQ
jgi:uncharacterized membrane protein YidH (DUF202 family)